MKVARTGERAADRRAEALGKINPGEVPARRHVAGTDADRDTRIQQPRAVHMGGEAVSYLAISTISSSAVFFQMVPPPILAVCSTLTRFAAAVARARVKGGAKAVGRELSVVAGQWRDLEAAKRCMRAAFAGDDVRAHMGEDFVARAATDQRRRDVAHGARRHEHGGFLAEQFGDAFA